jgi:hypothetical protein
MKKVSSRRQSSKHAVASKKKKEVYRVKNWACYNQALIQRGNLTVWFEQAAIDHWRYAGPPQRGAQFYYSDLAIETALTFRLLFNLPLRQTQGVVDSLLSLMGLTLSAPDYSTLSRRQAHLTVDLPVKPLLRQIPQGVARCDGDGAYDRWKVHRVLAYPGQAIEPIDTVVPPQRNASERKAKRHYRHIQARNERVQAIQLQGRKRWKQQTGYHRRSLAETGVARYKRIIGPKLRARVFLRQQVEACLGCKILNRMTHLGMPKAYKVEVDA